MNKKYFVAACFSLCGFVSCTKLDVAVESQLTEIPKTQESYVAATGSIYLKMSSQNFAVDLWRIQELSTDEAIIPNRNGSYYDNGSYIKLHKHTWTPSDVDIAWTWSYGSISECNRVLNLLEKAEEGTLKSTFIAEVKSMRALFYFYLMDLFGNVPITVYGTTENQEQSSRAQVFSYIEKELLAAAPDLAAPATVSTQYYGRPTRWMAYALLQKLYLNAEYYIGTARYADAITYGNKIMTESGLSLESNYMSLFRPTNGANKETILAAVFDASKAQGNYFTRYSLHGKHADKYGLNYTPSNAMCTIAKFYQLFSFPGDVRDTTWIAGPQYDFKGNAIMNGSSQLNLTPEIVFTDSATFNVGPEVNGISRGARSVKFYPDPNSVGRYQNNDIPILRLADVYLMQAEALLRNNGNVTTALELFNKIRRRSKAPEITSITLNDILDERARELAWECWRRNDLIRFGKWEAAWGFKAGGESPTRRLFPIPASEIILNPKLKQNDGY